MQLAAHPADGCQPDGAGILDPAAIEQVAREVWPDVRDADELHDALLTLITLPPVPEWQTFFEELSRRSARFVLLSRAGKRLLGRDRTRAIAPTTRSPSSAAGWNPPAPPRPPARGPPRFHPRRHRHRARPT